MTKVNTDWGHGRKWKYEDWERRANVEYGGLEIRAAETERRGGGLKLKKKKEKKNIACVKENNTDHIKSSVTAILHKDQRGL